MTKIQKLAEILNKCYLEGKRPEGVSPHDVAVLYDCYVDLAKNGHPVIFAVSVKATLENIGYITAPKGIGWVVIC